MKRISLFTLIGSFALCLSVPAFAGDHGRGGFGGGGFAGRGAAMAPQASHFSASVANFSRGGFRSAGFQAQPRFQAQQRFVTANPSFSRPTVNRTFTAPLATRVTAAPRMQRSAAAFTNNRVFPSNRTAFNRSNNFGGRWVRASAHPDWNRGHEYIWNRHHYRWFDGGWLIVDNGFWPDDYAYQPPYIGEYAPAEQPTTADVQSRLAQQGYYNGPVDGIVGPGTRSAIAAYQDDNGLTVTGTVDEPLLQSLGLE